MNEDLYLIKGHAIQDWNFVISAILGTYFGKGRTADSIIAAANQSMCFGVRSKRQNLQVAFARVITDGTVYSYLSDVVVHPTMLKQGIGTFLMRAIVNDEQLSRTFINLCTRDAHGFYEKFGFENGQQMFLRPK